MAVEIQSDRLTELNALGGAVLISTLLSKFIASAKKLTDQAARVIQAQNFEEYVYCIHTLKGSAMSLGLLPMGDLLVKLNERAKAQDFEGAQNDVAQLQSMLKEIEAFKTANYP